MMLLLRILEQHHSKGLKIKGLKRPKKMKRYVCLLKLLRSWKQPLSEKCFRFLKAQAFNTFNTQGYIKATGSHQPGAKAPNSRKYSTLGPRAHKTQT